MKKLSLILCCLALLTMACSSEHKNGGEDSLANDTALTDTTLAQPPDSLASDTTGDTTIRMQ